MRANTQCFDFYGPYREHAKPFKIVIAEIKGLKGWQLPDYFLHNIKSVTILNEEQQLLDKTFKDKVPDSQDIFYNCTRSKWKINPERANKALYAFSVYKGEILEVYEIESWQPVASFPILPAYQKGTKAILKSGLPNRYEFEGKSGTGGHKKALFGKIC